MSARLTAMVRENKERLKKQGDRLDKLEKTVTLLQKSLYDMEKLERTPSSGPAIPQTVPRPRALVELELGSDPKGA